MVVTVVFIVICFVSECLKLRLSVGGSLFSSIRVHCVLNIIIYGYCLSWCCSRLLHSRLYCTVYKQ